MISKENKDELKSFEDEILALNTILIEQTKKIQNLESNNFVY